MNIFLTIVLVGISLSMDAFSLALIYGMYALKKRDIIMLSSIVGLFHFFMPIIGLGIGSLISKYFFLNVDFCVGIIFSIIGIEMLISIIKSNDDISIMVNMFGFLLFAFSVSMDSFTTGIGLSLISDNYFFCSIVFMIISFLFTFCGLIFGKILNEKYGKFATFIGGVIMLILSFTYIF